MTSRISPGVNEVPHNRTGYYTARPTLRARDALTQAFVAFRL